MTAKAIEHEKPRKTRRVRTPTVLQMEAADCGAASLGIILGYYGRYVPLQDLRTACGVSRDGSNATNIIKAARAFALIGKGFKYELPEIYKASPPFIVFWNFNHFLVVEGFSKHSVYLNDPATGPRQVTHEQFDQSYTGVTLTLTPGPTFTKSGKPDTVLGALLPRLRGSRRALVYVILVGLGLVAPGLAIPSFGRLFLDDILIGGAQDWLAPLLVAMALTAVLRGALTALMKHYLGRLETKLALAGAGRFLWHLLRLPVAFFSARQTGDISSRMNANSELARLLSGELGENAINVLTIALYAALMFSYDHLLCGIGVFIAFLNFAALRWAGRRRVDQNLRLQQDQGKLYGTAVGGIQLIESLKAGGLENDFFSRWAGNQVKVTNAEQQLAVSTEVLRSFPTLLSGLSVTAVLGVGSLRVMDGHLSMGELIAFQSLMASFLAPVNGLVNLASTLQEVQGALGRLDDVYKYQEDPIFSIRADKKGLKALPQGTVRLNGYIELRNLTFGYNRLAPPLIDNFSLKLRPGSRVALVGGSGSGKSTVAKMVAGLFQPWSGEILFDGVPRNQVPRSVLNSSLAMVDQDIFLFEGSIRDNLTMWDATIPEQQIVAAAKDAVIHQEISQREGGYDGQVEEGGRNFSGGQRQRLELARALAVNPSILIMDEGTSALDPVTELLVDRHLRQRSCTCIIIAHRLSTIRDCDEILVLDRGKVLERGTHAQMSQGHGPYAQLIRSA